MTGIKLSTTAMLLSGTATTALTVADPKDLEGLGPTALLALITLASLGTLAYFVKSLIPVFRDLVRETATQNTMMKEMCARMNVRPCLLQPNEDEHEHSKH